MSEATQVLVWIDHGQVKVFNLYSVMSRKFVLKEVLRHVRGYYPLDEEFGLHLLHDEMTIGELVRWVHLYAVDDETLETFKIVNVE